MAITVILPSGLSNTGNFAVGSLSATGNLTGNYILGNGALLTGVSTSSSNINNGTSNVTVVSSGGNITVGVGGTSNVAVFATTGEYVTGVVSATGNITGNYFIGNGSLLTGISGGGGGANIANGTSNVTVVSSGGNVTVGIGGTGNVVVWATTGEYITGVLSVSGNTTVGGNLIVSGNITDAGQLDISTTAANGNIVLTPNGSGNVNTPANVSVAGNVTGSNLNIAGSGGTISGTGNIIAGNLSATGNVIVVGVAASGNISATGNIQAGNISTAGNVNGANIVATTLSATGNVVANNVMATNIVNVASHTGTVVSVTGNVTANNGMFTTIVNVASHTGTVVSVTGNVNGGNVISAALSQAVTLSATGNVIGGNISTAGNLTFSSTGQRIFGDFSNATLANRLMFQNRVANGDTQVYAIPNGTSVIASFSAVNNSNPANAGIAQFAATSTDARFQSAINGTGPYIPLTFYTGGSERARIDINGNVGIGNTAPNTTLGVTGNAYVSGNITGGNILTSGSGGNITGANVISATTLSATANVTGGNIITGGVIAGNNNIVINAPAVGEGGQLVLAWGNTANIYGQANRSWNVDVDSSNNFRIFYQDATAGTGVPISITQTSNLVTMVGPLSVNSGSNVTAIINGAANAVGNIGSSTTYFNRLFAQATTALYADLAEMYTTDAEYEPGTVLIFGGNQEVTVSTVTHDHRVAGVVSTNPAHIMNSGLQGEFTVAVALTGRVPVSVIGNINAGDRVVSSNRAGVAEALDITRYQPGVIIGKALQSYSGNGVGVIEVVVGRL